MGRPRGQRAGGSNRKTRPGGRRTASRGGSGGVTITSVSPVGNISGTSPTVQATVKDSRSTLAPSDIQVYLDGQVVQRFQYRRTTGKLSFAPGRQSSGAHTVRIEVNSGGSKNAGKSWSFVVE